MLGSGIGSAPPLQIGKDPVAAFLMQRIEMLAEAILVIHLNLNPFSASASSGLCRPSKRCLES
jgi:hypothetical protein